MRKNGMREGEGGREGSERGRKEVGKEGGLDRGRRGRAEVREGGREREKKERRKMRDGMEEERRESRRKIRTRSILSPTLTFAFSRRPLSFSSCPWLCRDPSAVPA